MLLRRVGIVLLALLLVLASAYAIVRAVAQPAAPHPWFAPRQGEHRPLVFAHRGAAGLRPENTLLAFGHAAALGADVLDTDVRMTRDGALVLMHDPTVERTTDGSGAIGELTLAQVRRLDAAYRFSTDGGRSHPYRGQGVTVPTLEELFRAFPRLRFGIELKGGDAVAAARSLCALVRRHAMQDKVLASSFARDRMDAFRRECPEVATSATRDEARVFFALLAFGLTDLASPAYQSLQVPARAGERELVTPHLIESARRRGLAVQPWTLNEEADLKRALALGVDGISTDFPDRLLTLLRNR